MSAKWRCPGCGLSVPIDKRDVRIACACGGVYDLAGGAWRLKATSPAPEQQKSLSLAARTRRYAGAVRRWIAAGRPTRPQGEIDRILTECCQPCEHYRATNAAKGEGVCTHSLCGCRVNRNPRAFANKLAMGTEACPIGLWQAAAPALEGETTTAAEEAAADQN